MMLLSLVLSAAAATAVPAIDPALSEPDPSHMTLKEIRAFNKVVGANHPYYIRCRSDVEIGSIAKAHTVCRTLRDWSQADEAGNRVARDTVRFLNETAGSMGN